MFNNLTQLVKQYRIEKLPQFKQVFSVVFSMADLFILIGVIRLRRTLPEAQALRAKLRLMR